MPKKATTLPKYVKKSGRQYVYRPYIPKAKRTHINTDKYGYLAPPIILCSIDAADHTLYAALGLAMQQLARDQVSDDDYPYLSVGWLAEAYLVSRLYKNLASKTQQSYRKNLAILEHPIRINGKQVALAQLPAVQLKTTIIRRILDKRLDQYQAKGLKGESRCNNEKAVLSALYRYGIQYIDELADLKNPAHGITKFQVAIRDRYVTPQEYQLQYNMAKNKSPAYLPIVMELCYLLAARGIEVTDLTIASANKVGIHVKRRKGSRDTLINWTDRLEAAWATALALHQVKPLATTPLLIGQSGYPVTKSAINKAWQTLKKHMEDAGHQALYFRLHDLKRRGISNASDDRLAGHISDSTRSNYSVKLDRFDPPSSTER